MGVNQTVLLSVVVPAHDEQENIRTLATEIRSDLLPETELQSRNCNWREVIPVTFRSPRFDPGWRFCFQVLAISSRQPGSVEPVR